MKKKVYEVPAILVYKTAPTMPLCNSGGDIEDWARGTSWFDAEEFDAEEFFARIICHEVDHLNGILYTDKVDITSVMHNEKPLELQK